MYIILKWEFSTTLSPAWFYRTDSSGTSNHYLNRKRNILIELTSSQNISKSYRKSFQSSAKIKGVSSSSKPADEWSFGGLTKTLQSESWEKTLRLFSSAENITVGCVTSGYCYLFEEVSRFSSSRNHFYQPSLLNYFPDKWCFLGETGEGLRLPRFKPQCRKWLVDHHHG